MVSDQVTSELIHKFGTSLITSNHIIKLSNFFTESLVDVQSQEDIRKNIISWIDYWTHVRDALVSFPQSKFLYIKRYLPQSIYSGKIWRFVAVNLYKLKKNGFIKDSEDVLNLTVNQVRQILSNNKQLIGKKSHWTKDNSLAQDYFKDAQNKFDVVFLISDHTYDGIDIESIYNYFKLNYPFEEKEIIAPFNPNSFKLESLGWNNSIKTFH